MIGREQQRAVAHRLRDRGARSGHDRLLERHRLEQRNAEALVLARGHDHVGRAEHRREIGLVDRPDDVHAREVELVDLLAYRTAVALEPLVPDEHQEAAESEVRLGDVHHLHEEVGPLVRHQLSDRQQDRSVETSRGGAASTRAARPARGDAGRRPAARRARRGSPSPRARARCTRSRRSRTPRAGAVARPRAARDRADRRTPGRTVEVSAGRDVVVHEHERFGRAVRNSCTAGLTDRRVEDQEAAGVQCAVLREREHVVVELRRDVVRVDLRRPDPPQQPTRSEREVGDRVARRRRDEHLVDADADGCLSSTDALIGSRRWRSPAARTTTR